MTAPAPHDTALSDTALSDLAADVEQARSPSPQPPRSRLVVFVAVAIALVIAAGGATFAVDQSMRIAVPDVTGSRFADAVAALERDGLSVDAGDSTRDDFCVNASHEQWCTVVSQQPAAGERLHARTPVALVVAPIAVGIPDATGIPFAEAAAMLEGAGLSATLSDPAIAEIEGHREWTVAAQSPAFGADLLAGTNVALTLARPAVVVAPVVGLPVAEAAASLESAGLIVTYTLPEGMDELEGEPLPSPWIVTGSTPVLDGPLFDGSLPIGTTVELEWGVRMPEVVGMPGEDAEDAIVQLGLEAEFAEGSPTDTRVVAQQWDAGAVLAPGEAVALTTSPAKVVFEVVTDEGGASIVATTPVAFEEAKAKTAKGQWRTTYSAGTTPDVYTRGSISATATGAARSITCSISVNGVEVATDTAKGKGASVSCQ